MDTQSHIFDNFLQPWEGKAIGLLDLDAFFASVEQLDHPEWRGKPVIVGGHSDKRGVVAAASYEARKFGVHSAMPAAQAERLCPHAIWAEGRHERYRELSKQVMDLIRDETPYVQPISIDEAFFDVTPGRYSKENPVLIAQRIKQRVSDMGITCSIGLSNNKTTSKIASNRDKPNGLTIIYPGCEREFLAPLPIKELSGVGPKTEVKLKAAHIYTLGDLAEADSQLLEELLGVWGPRLKARAQGLEESPVEVEDETKSVSHERTFSHDLYEKDEIIAAIGYIAALVGRRMRKHGLKGTTVTLKVRFNYETTKTIQQKLPYATDNEHVIIPILKELLLQVWTEGMPVRLLGVGLSDFSEITEQLDLFDSTTTEPKDELAKATDEVREKFGDISLVYGRELKIKEKLSKSSSLFKEKS